MGQQANTVILKVVILSFSHFILQGESVSLNCTFDNDFCSWVQDDSDDFDWARRTDKSYIYIEGDGNARIISSKQRPGPFCLTFFYKMYGSDMGSVNVYMRTDGENDNLIIFTKYNDILSPDWRRAVIGYTSNAVFQVIIEGFRSDYRLDIFIDEISMTDRFCSVVSDCNFDSGLCHWVQDYNDDFDWTLGKGETQTRGTGPSTDHTSGSGFYIYIDTSDAYKGESARLISPLIKAGKYCFSFWYHMYGNHIDTLTVHKAEQKKNATEIFKISGNQGEKWIKRNISIESGMYFKVIIEGKVLDRRWHSKGDIAIDDVTIISCQDCDSPLPNNGKTNSSNYQYGAVVEVTCDLGYYLIGPTILVCHSDGIWNASVSCEPIDCLTPNIANGAMSGTNNNTTYNQTVDIACEVGYNLVGNRSITCQADGYWSNPPICDLRDCLPPNIANGAMSGPNNNTTYDQTVDIACEVGYNLVGNRSITCQADGYWSNPPICDLRDCLTPNIANGAMSGPNNNTTYNQIVDIACADGYDLVGNKSITCQADGYWSTPPTCELHEPVNKSALTAVYVTVPLAAVGLFIAFLTVILRKRILRLCVIRGSHEQVKKEQPQPKTLFNNMAYSETFNENQSNQDGDISQDEEYAVVADNMNELGQGDIPAYYNIVDAAVTSIKEHEHTYNHTTISGRLVTDNTYSHLAGDKNMIESNYNTTEFPFSGNTSSQLNTNPRNNNYDVLNTKKTQQRCGIDAQPDIQHEEDSEYDHAQAGGTDPKDIDDYSNLNVETDKYRPECSEIKYGTNTKEQTERETKAYKQSEDETPEYYVLEPQPVSRGEDERHYFVLEREDS